MKKSIELTQEEGQVLINLINVAVQSKGLDAAEAGLYFTKLIQSAFAPANEKPVLEVKK